MRKLQKQCAINHASPVALRDGDACNLAQWRRNQHCAMKWRYDHAITCILHLYFVFLNFTFYMCNYIQYIFIYIYIYIIIYIYI